MTEPARDRGDTLRAALAKFTDAMVGLLRTRLELVAVEYTEERDRVARQLILLLVGLGCLLFALLFASLAIIAYYWDTHRITAILGVTAFFLVVGAGLLWRRTELSRTSPVPFASSVAELEKDRAAIARTMNLPPT
jgi:uncharacterized membrane protein YqjE